MSLFDTPPDFVDPLTQKPDEPTSSDPTCTVCGDAIPWAGRGRKPTKCELHKSSRSGSTKSSASSSRGKVSDANLNQACSTLRDAYDAALIPLMIFSPKGATVWNDQIGPLDERNHKYLANNPDLVKRINSVGEKGGAAAFYLSHVFAITPVLFAIYADMGGNKPKRGHTPPPPAPSFDYDVPDDASGIEDPVIDPDAAFRGGH